MEMFDQAANVGRERGSESPISVSPAMATLAGRTDPSIKLCTPIKWAAAAKEAPRIPYWASRDKVAPAIAPTTTNSRAPQTTMLPNPRATARRE
jgi:hypothetical protein